MMKMKFFNRINLLLLLLSLAIACEKIPQESPSTVIDEGITIYGYVTAGGTGLPNVVVSDGVVVTTTGEDGQYTLKSSKSTTAVFVSTPSGYEPQADGVVPAFFRRFSRAPEELERIDFKLTAVDQRNFKLLALGDMHLADRQFCNDLGQFRRFAREVSEFAAESDVPVYAVTLGDMTWDQFRVANSFGFPEYLKELKKDLSGMLVYHSMGNHDNNPEYVGDVEAQREYEMSICPNHYSLNIGEVHLVVLDDILYNNNASGVRSFYPQLSKDQLEWLKADLKYVDQSTPILVAMHTPFYYRDASSALYNFSELLHCFDGFDYVQFLTGHTHVVYNVDMLSRSVHVFETNSGAVCGAWWMTDTACKAGFNICSDGAPAGYRILDIQGKDIEWIYKGTGCDEDFQFRTYDRNEFCFDVAGWVPHASSEGRQAFTDAVGAYAVKSTANQVLINIWDYDPSWKISVTENGRQLEVKQLKNTKDPLYLASYEAYEYEHGFSVSYPCGHTDHIFSVTASSPSSTLDIEVTDRFGRTYTQQMKRPQAFYEPR